MADEPREVFKVNVAGVERDLPLFEVAPGIRIAILNILGDNELVEAASKGLAEQLADLGPEMLVTPEAKSIPLIYALSKVMDVPYAVLRKDYKPYMGKALKAETLSITTGKTQTLYLDERDIKNITGRRVALIDDVISTGSTLQAMRILMEKAGAEIIAEAAIFTEGDQAKWTNVKALGHLPVFVDKK
ncbi:MAG: adenine phosphoribosyltransferase [Chloroflexota bacterium]|nr:adenine phosphoribosyltransferase [Chloroflexota bacterium]NOG65239.1 adenine phosphoribosyltransferase [Chloroflexota bacterium]GIK66627.1 MAG: adenine phosphoribosyltransferase [Chloroflexota bacterium]